LQDFYWCLKCYWN